MVKKQKTPVKKLLIFIGGYMQARDRAARFAPDGQKPGRLI